MSALFKALVRENFTIVFLIAAANAKTKCYIYICICIYKNVLYLLIWCMGAMAVAHFWVYALS